MLEGEVSSAVKSDSQEKQIEGTSSYEAWAKQDREFNEMLTFVEIVAETRDPRGIRLLRRALSSPNSETQNSAASGLARAQDMDSVQLIIDVCKNAPPDVASVIAANALVYFDDPRAQSAVDQYLSKDAAKFAREEKAGGYWSSWTVASEIGRQSLERIVPLLCAWMGQVSKRVFGEGRE